MDILNTIRDGLSGWQVRPPGASPEIVDMLAAKAPIELPPEYLALLRFSNGAEGELGVEPGWFMFWPAEKVLEHNEGYNLAEFLPGFFGFGSSGGGNLFAFDTRRSQPWPVITVPFAFELALVVTMAPDFEAFLRLLGHVLPMPPCS